MTMARSESKYYEVDWDRFCQIVIEKWRQKIQDRGLIDTGNLYQSLSYGYRGVNSLNQTVGRGSGAELKIPDVVTFTFPMYGIYADRGAGRGNRIRGHHRGKGHTQWFYQTFYEQRKRLGELVGQMYGYAAQQQILTIQVKVKAE